MLVIYQKYRNAIQSVHNCSVKQKNRFSTRRLQMSELMWLCFVAMEKSSSYIPTSKLMRSCSNEHISKLVMLFNLAFLMKCKYII